MNDLSLKSLGDGAYDLDFDTESMDLGTTDGLENAILLSLGTFARERSLDNVESNLGTVRGGWWGDSLDSEGTLGGHVFEAFPSKNEQSSMDNVAQLSKESLTWMIDEGVASSVDCSASVSDGTLVIAVVVSKPDGSEMNLAYEMNWESTCEV